LSRVEALSCMRWGMPGIATCGRDAVVRCCRGRPPELQAAYMGQARASQSAAIVISGKPRKARPRRGRGAGAGLFGMAGARLRGRHLLCLGCLGGADGDGAGLEPLRDVADQLDMEQAVLEVGALHLDVVGELEAPLEVARGDAAVQVLALLVVRLLGAGDGERLLLEVDADLVLGEARHRHRDAVVVLAKPLDVVGRIAGRGLVKPGHRVEQVEKPVEADGGAIEGSKIDGSHDRCPPSEATCHLPAPTVGSGLVTHLPRGARQHSVRTRSAACARRYLGVAGAASRGAAARPAGVPWQAGSAPKWRTT